MTDFAPIGHEVITPPDAAEPETALSKAARLLDIVLETQPIGSRELAAVAGVPESTCRRLLRHLENADLILENHGRYRVTARVYGHDGRGPAPWQLARACRPVLTRLQALTRETSLCAVRSGLHAVILDEEPSTFTRRIIHRRGQLMPLYAGASQRSLLAFAPPEVLEAVLTRGLGKLTEGTPDERALLQSLEKIRQTGVAVSRGEILPESIAIAVPVMVDGNVVCSLAVTGFEARCDAKWQASTAAALRDATRLLRELLAE